MPNEFDATQVKRVVEVSTNIGAGCDHCSQSIGLEDFAESVNHYIQKHGYGVLHVGQQTTHDRNANPWQATVARGGAGPPSWA